MNEKYIWSFVLGAIAALIVATSMPGRTPQACKDLIEIDNNIFSSIVTLSPQYIADNTDKRIELIQKCQ